MNVEARAPTELELARARLARSRAQVQRQFQPATSGPSSLMRSLALQGVQSLVGGLAGGGGLGNSLRLAMSVAALVATSLRRRRSVQWTDRLATTGRVINMALPLLLAVLRFARRR
jgi:hypothetical protein